MLLKSTKAIGVSVINSVHYIHFSNGMSISINAIEPLIRRANFSNVFTQEFVILTKNSNVMAIGFDSKYLLLKTGQVTNFSDIMFKLKFL